MCCTYTPLDLSRENYNSPRFVDFLSFGISEPFSPRARYFTLGWGGRPFAQSFLPGLHERLRVLTFDFLSDDTLRPLTSFDDRSFLPNILSVTFSGTTKHISWETHDVVTLLLTKLGSALQIFSYLPETPSERRGVDQGRLPPQVGPLPRVWANRHELQVLEIDRLRRYARSLRFGGIFFNKRMISYIERN